jgi:hypothetical protein
VVQTFADLNDWLAKFPCWGEHGGLHFRPSSPKRLKYQETSCWVGELPGLVLRWLLLEREDERGRLRAWVACDEATWR